MVNRDQGRQSEKQISGKIVALKEKYGDQTHKGQKTAEDPLSLQFSFHGKSFLREQCHFITDPVESH